MHLKTFASAPLTYVFLALGFAAGAGFFAWRQQDGGGRTFVVRRGDFIQQISVGGTVVPARHVDLVFSQGGRIAAVHARVGDRVRQDTVLAAMENGDLAADVRQKRAALDAAAARLALLERGARPEEIAVTRSRVLSAETAVAAADAALADAVRDAYTRSDDAVRNRTDQFISNARTAPQLNFMLADGRLKTEIEESRSAMELLLEGWKKDLDRGAADAERAGKYLGDVRAFMDRVALVVNGLTPGGNFSQSVIDGYRADVTAGRSNLANAAAALTGAKTQQKNAAASLTTAQRNLDLQVAGALPEDLMVRRSEADIAAAELARAEAQYRKTLIVAPFAGIVTRMDAKVGGSASSNAVLISLMSGDMLQMESFVPEIHAPLLEIGDEATATLDAYGAAPFAARVVAVDPVETVRDGVATYRTTLQFARQDERLRPGMTGQIMITTERKAGVITVPQAAIAYRDDIALVRVDHDGAVTERSVRIGSISATGAVEITDGLAEGETVVLQE